MDQSQNPDVIKDIESPPVPTVTATTTTVTGGTTAASNANPADDMQTTTTTAKKQTGGGATSDAIKKAAASVMHLQTIDYLALNSLFSWVVMIPSAQACENLNTTPGTGGCRSYFMSYAVAAGTVTGVLNLIVFLLDVFKRAPSDAVLSWIALFTFLWWFAAAVVLTFFNPYTTIVVANGYFATWLAFITASLALMKGGMKFNETAQEYWDKLKRAQKPSFFLFLSSTVVMGAAIGPCSPEHNCHNWNAFAIALSVISQILALAICFGARCLPHTVIRLTANFLVFWWILGTGIVTFGQPFKQAGNGYFASFVSIFLAFVVARVASEEALEGAE